MSEVRHVQRPGGPVIPDKLYFRIGEVARLLEVETHTLRFWETEFPQLKVGKGGTGQRLYRRRDVEVAFEIKHLLYQQGYTIPGARQALQSRQRRKEPAAAPVPAVSAAAAQGGLGEPSLERIRAGLRDLSALLSDPASPERTSANTRDPGTRSAPQPPRRGLHLAARSPTKPALARNLPSLFEE